MLFIMYTRPTGPQTFRILLSLPPFSLWEPWDYRHPHMGSGDSNSGSQACVTSSLPSVPFPLPHSCLKHLLATVIHQILKSLGATLPSQHLNLQIRKMKWLANFSYSVPPNMSRILDYPQKTSMMATPLELGPTYICRQNPHPSCHHPAGNCWPSSVCMRCLPF